MCEDLLQNSCDHFEVWNTVHRQAAFKNRFHLNWWARSSHRQWFKRAIKRLPKMIDASNLEPDKWFFASCFRQIFSMRTMFALPFLGRMTRRLFSLISPWSIVLHVTSNSWHRLVFHSAALIRVSWDMKPVKYKGLCSSHFLLSILFPFKWTSREDWCAHHKNCVFFF